MIFRWINDDNRADEASNHSEEFVVRKGVAATVTGTLSHVEGFMEKIRDHVDFVPCSPSIYQ